MHRDTERYTSTHLHRRAHTCTHKMCTAHGVPLTAVKGKGRTRKAFTVSRQIDAVCALTPLLTPPCPTRVSPPPPLGSQPFVSSAKTWPSLCRLIRLQPPLQNVHIPSSPCPISVLSFPAKRILLPHASTSLLFLNPPWSAFQCPPHTEKWLASESPTTPCSEFDRHPLIDTLPGPAQPAALRCTADAQTCTSSPDLRPHSTPLSAYLRAPHVSRPHQASLSRSALDPSFSHMSFSLSPKRILNPCTSLSVQCLHLNPSHFSPSQAPGQY